MQVAETGKNAGGPAFRLAVIAALSCFMPAHRPAVPETITCSSSVNESKPSEYTSAPSAFL
jgi:hypothetical protein